MKLRGLILGSAPNPKDFGYPNPQIRGSKLGTKPETRKPETSGYPPRTRPAANHRRAARRQVTAVRSDLQILDAIQNSLTVEVGSSLSICLLDIWLHYWLLVWYFGL